MWNLKYGTNEPIYERGTASQNSLTEQPRRTASKNSLTEQPHRTASQNSLQLRGSGVTSSAFVPCQIITNML